MMGLLTPQPFITFTEHGFPKALIDELEAKTNHKIIGNKAASGTEIIKELGVQQMKEKALIVYTSSDSVLQIAANEAVISVLELYRCCDIAREICMRPEYKVGRIIARPFIGDNPDNFKRTSSRHDLALSPASATVMDVLKDHHYMVSCVGKIGDIFNNQGVVNTLKTVSNHDGMEKCIHIAATEDFQGLCFVNLVEFDSEYGHRRNPLGYANCIEEFDTDLGALLKVLRDDDLLIVTADHGNDPIHHGTDHTREDVPLVFYSRQITKGKLLATRKSFADLGITILENFHLSKTAKMIGESVKEVL
jgi:phosphopentomutase